MAALFLSQAYLSQTSKIIFPDNQTATAYSGRCIRQRSIGISLNVAGATSAWDCATGTGQAARGLAGYFERVVATDGSEQQIINATGPVNVSFRVATAECSGLETSSVDLITVAQALHWFELDIFYQEVRRVVKPGGPLNDSWSGTRIRPSLFPFRN